MTRATPRDTSFENKHVLYAYFFIHSTNEIPSFWSCRCHAVVVAEAPLPQGMTSLRKKDIKLPVG